MKVATAQKVRMIKIADKKGKCFVDFGKKWPKALRDCLTRIEVGMAIY